MNINLYKIAGAFFFAHAVSLVAADYTPPSCDEGVQIQEISLSDAINAAYADNPQILSAREDIEKSKAAKVGATTGFLPSANASIEEEHFVSYQPPGTLPVSVGTSIIGGPASVYSNYPTIGVNLNLFNGGKDIAGYQGAAAGVRAAERDLDDKINTDLSGVLSAYVDLLKAQVSSHQQWQAAILTEKILQTTESRYAQGRESLLTVNQNTTTLAQDERAYYESCKDLTDKSAALAQAVGTRIDPNFLFQAATLTLPDPVTVSGNARSFDEVVQDDPAVKAAQEKVEEALEKTKQARAAFLPTLAVVGRYDWLGQSVNNLGDAYHDTDRNSYRVAIVLQQSLGPFTSEYATARSARADYAKAQDDYETALIDAEARLRSAWNGKRQIHLALEAARRSFEHAGETLQLSEQLFEKGRVAQDTVDQAKIASDKELEAIEELEQEDRLQGWLIYRAMDPEGFSKKVMELFANGGVDDAVGANGQ